MVVQVDERGPDLPRSHALRPLFRHHFRRTNIPITPPPFIIQAAIRVSHPHILPPEKPLQPSHHLGGGPYDICVGGKYGDTNAAPVALAYLPRSSSLVLDLVTWLLLLEC